MIYLLCISMAFGYFPVSVTAFNYTELWRNACPFSNSCTLGSLRQFNVSDEGFSQPCCRSCSCEKDCWLFKDCCPDVTHERPNIERPARCKQVTNEASVKYRRFLNNYRVLDFCPTDYDDTGIIDQCKQPPAGVKSLIDFVAVSDVNDRLYKNKYCAWCNGVTDVVSWKLKLIKCNNGLISKPILGATFIQELMENCVVESVPPTSRLKSRMDRKVCGLNIRYTCPKNTKPDIQHIVDECVHGEPLNFISSVTNQPELGYYKNVFCYLCSNDDVVNNVCPLDTGDIPGKLVVASRGLMLDMTLGDKIQSGTSRTKSLSVFICEETELYDHVKESCPQLFCPRFHAAWHGQCLKIGSPVANYGIELRIQYEPAHQLFFEEIGMYNYQMAQDYVRTILRKNGLDNCEATHFFVGAFLEENTTRLAYVQIEMKILFDEFCLLDDVVGAIRSRLSTRDELTLVINNMEVQLFGNVIFAHSDYARGYTQHALVYVHGPYADIDYDSTFFLCPYIKFDIRQYNAIATEVFGQGREIKKTELSQFTQVEPGFYILSNDTIALCVDTYFELYKSHHSRQVQTNGVLGLFLSFRAWSLFWVTLVWRRVIHN